ncbi:hypothetical protein IC229_24805 [Spirosoma sp. BT702]|uniref:WYL domain-containing protein n=1 Tax=Spirosoma profusum TaxID=2771354 RepID=A0A927ATM3_9BACT|nr:WYL domain-containing protein [Spirosoma profusum]MBD2703890.1 hypothetical protein [Spirosoma profusum]
MKFIQQDNLLRTIESAIANQQVIQMKLGSTWRTIEPYQIGPQKGIEQSISVYGYCRDIVADARTPSRWQLFRVDDIDVVELTNYSFQPHIDYTGKEELLQSTFCQLRLNKGKLKNSYKQKSPVR